MAAEVPPGPIPASPTDHDLLAAARRGDAAALETLLIRYQPHLYRFGLRMCGNEDDAADVAQESLISMAKSVDGFRGEASVSTWLYTIARRFCIKKRRRGKFAPAQEESLDAPGVDAAQRLADGGPSPEQAASNNELQVALARAIASLEPAHREVLVLRDMEGLSAPEVAQVLGISVDAVKSRLHRARTAARHALIPVIGGREDESARDEACPDVLTLFSQHLEGEIDQATCASMEAHLAACARCRSACDSLKRALAICRESPAPQVPATVAMSIKSAIRALLDKR
jgi:RNA polymerase sigma-70 factor (ECF subfamily)